MSHEKEDALKSLELTCIRCPVGCQLEVTLQNREVLSVTGNECRLGLEYAKVESIAPMRSVTTTLPLAGGQVAMLPVKSSVDIPKGDCFTFMNALRGLSATAPITVGDVVAKNVGNTGADLLATRTVLKKDSLL